MLECLWDKVQARSGATERTLLHLRLGLVQGSHGGGQLEATARQVNRPGRRAQDVGHQQEGDVHVHAVQVFKLHATNTELNICWIYE